MAVARNDKSRHGSIRSATGSQQAIRSPERVRDLGEVLTPPRLVEAMLDLLPQEVWNVHPAQTFLEPACGDGNFLVAVLDRKMQRVIDEWSAAKLPGGDTVDALEFHMLEGLSAIYGVELSPDNVLGGGPHNIVGARQRMVRHFASWHETALGDRPRAQTSVLLAAARIVEANIQVGNMLTATQSAAEGTSADIPLVEYDWEPKTMRVRLTSTTLREVMAEAQERNSGQLAFGLGAGESATWEGHFSELHRVQVRGLSFGARDGNRTSALRSDPDAGYRR